jgi:hypothetical protein
MQRSCLPRAFRMVIGIPIPGVHFLATRQSIGPPRFFVAGEDKDVVMIVRQPLRVIRDRVFLLPDCVGDKVLPTEDLVAKNL